jgi:hypothetical protein
MFYKEKKRLDMISVPLYRIPVPILYQFRLFKITRDAPDIRPDNPAFFYIRYPAGYQIALPDIR